MRVAYRESVGETVEMELELDKVVDRESLYAKIKLGLESTLEECDVAEIQKRKFDDHLIAVDEEQLCSQVVKVAAAVFSGQ